MLRALLTPPSKLSLPDTHPLVLSRLSEDPGLRQRLYFAAALTPFWGTTYRTPKGETRPAVEAVVREALKRGKQNHLAEGVPSLFNGAALLHGPDARRYAGPNERSQIG